MIRDFTPEFYAQQDELLKQQRWTRRAEELREMQLEPVTEPVKQEQTSEVSKDAQR